MRLLTLVAISTVAITAMPSRADQPFGWACNGHASAYALHQGEFELSGNLLRVNDNFDFLNLRDELLAGTQRLVCNSGDLTGNV